MRRRRNSRMILVFKPDNSPGSIHILIELGEKQQNHDHFLQAVFVSSDEALEWYSSLTADHSFSYLVSTFWNKEISTNINNDHVSRGPSKSLTIGISSTAIKLHGISFYSIDIPCAAMLWYWAHVLTDELMFHFIVALFLPFVAWVITLLVSQSLLGPNDLS